VSAWAQDATEREVKACIFGTGLGAHEIRLVFANRTARAFERKLPLQGKTDCAPCGID